MSCMGAISCQRLQEESDMRMGLVSLTVLKIARIIITTMLASKFNPLKEYSMLTNN